MAVNAMIRDNHILLEVSGTGASPERISARNLGRILTALEKVVIVLAQQIAPELPESDLFISLVDVKHGNSGDYTIALPLPSIQLAAFNQFTTLLEKNALDKLPPTAIEQADEIAKVSRKEGYVISFAARTNGHIARTTINPDTKYVVPLQSHVEGETVIYGEIERVGGKTPQVVIRISENQTIAAKCSRKMAELLSPHLYKTRGLKGIAKWRLEDFEIVEFMVTDLEPYEAIPIERALSDLRDVAGPYYDAIDDVEGFINDQRDD